MAITTGTIDIIETVGIEGTDETIEIIETSEVYTAETPEDLAEIFGMTMGELADIQEEIEARGIDG